MAQTDNGKALALEGLRREHERLLRLTPEAAARVLAAALHADILGGACLPHSIQMAVGGNGTYQKTFYKYKL